jgi:tetratricopeptide (TPR) repeat protein
MRPFWVTFYSYKGGVGRTLALANSAVLLAQSGRNVLMVDFDLEAPGLDSFAELGITPGRPGVVEYFTEFAEAGTAPQLSNYVEACRAFPGGGELWLMPSGTKDKDYNRKRDQLNWSELYDVGLGALLIEEWKAEIQLRIQPDYVFVDSRTGLTDIGGVCTLHLPDLVVALFALNKQNLDGVRSVIAAIETASTDRRPEIITVATPVPESSTDTGQIELALRNAANCLGQPTNLQISYNAAAALSEKIFALEDTKIRRQISVQYEDLVDLLKEKNIGGIDDLLKKATRAVESDDERAAREILSLLKAEYPHRADAVYQAAEIIRRFEGREQAVPYWERAIALDPTLDTAFQALVNFYNSKQQFVKIVGLCKDNMRARPHASDEDLEETLGFLGEALMALDRPTEAREFYERCFEITPSDVIHAFNLAESTRRSTGQNPQHLWHQVVSLYLDDRKEISGVRANHAQAMHIAYACIGELATARDLLLEARRQATLLAASTEIFSVKVFHYVNRESFLNFNTECLETIEGGKLWDGMLLPTADTDRTSLTSQ